MYKLYLCLRERISAHWRAWGGVRMLTAFLLLAYLLCLPVELFDLPYATVVSDRRGELLGARIAADGQWRFPPSDSIPDKFRRCIVAFEDRHFYRHPGVNPLAILRALWQNIEAGRVLSGGSTLTMQTVRLARKAERNLSEKLLEALLATRLECRYTKEEILCLYASHAPFGGNVVGLEAAAWRYFGHSAAELSWAEAATLAVLPNAPAAIHPGRKREALLAKRNRLLAYLHRQGRLDDQAYDLALSEELPPATRSLPQNAPHLVSELSRRKPGENIHTSIDKDLQQQVEALLERWHRNFVRNDIRNLTALVLDVSTMRPLAYCGNVHFDRRSSANQVDIVRAPRSTGSILKPFLYYAALKEGTILPHCLLPDLPMNVNGFVPQNFNKQYAGAVPASEVLARSLNIPSVYLLRRYGVAPFCRLLKEMGLTTITRPASDYGLSLILGGAEATLWDLSQAYAAMARALQGLEPLWGSPVAGEKPAAAAFAFEPGAVWQVFDAIKELNRPEEVDWRLIPSMQTIAWKTGTSYGFRDAWAIGVTARYVVGVWVGNANGEGKPELIGARTAAPVMFDIFNLLPASPWFRMPEGAFTRAEVCRQSGQLRGPYCDEVDTALVLPAGLRTAACPYHIPVTLDPSGRYRVYQNCIETGQSLRKRHFFVLPPAWEYYYKQQHPDYESLPPFLPGCGGEGQVPMAFIYPENHARVYLPRQLDGSEGLLTLELAHSNPAATVFWHIDSEYLGATRDFHKYSLRPAAGKHSITVVDDQGYSLSLSIEVE